MTQHFSTLRERAWWLLICAALLFALTSLGTAQAQDQVSNAPLVPPAATAFTEPFDNASQFTTNATFFSDAGVSSGFDYFGIAGTSPDWGGDPAPSGLKAYTGFTDNYLAGMDLDGEGATLPIVVDWTGISITGLSDLTFEGDFAEFFDSPGDIDDSDYIRLEYQIDGGGYQNLLWFSGADFDSPPFNGIFRQDTNFDGTGDGNALTDTAQTFSAAIAGTGDSLDLRMSVSVNSGDEDFAVDNFTVLEAVPDTTPPAVVSVDPADDSIDVPTGETLSIVFDEPIQFSTDTNLRLQIGDSLGLVEAFFPTDPTDPISIVNGNTVVVDPTNALPANDNIFVVIDAGMILDSAGNEYAGITNPSTWNFTTVAPATTIQAPIFEDLETTCPPTDWAIFSQDADDANTWLCADNDGDTVLNANGFGNSAPADEWIITPEIDFSSLTSPTATFETWTRFSDGGIAYPQLEFLYSTDYDGAGGIDSATWTSLGYTPSPEDSQIWTPSGNIDLSGIGATSAYFAFRYQSSGTGGGSAAWWQVDDFSIDEPPPPEVAINELGVSDTGADAEFFELFGTDGTSLDGVYLVALYASNIDAARNKGTVITVLDLNANSIQADGFFVGSSPEANATYSFTSDYAFADNTFENAAATYALVYNASGVLLAAGDDLDTDDDGVLDIVPWTDVLSSVALTEGANTETFYFNAPVVGPDGSFLPAGTYACPDGGTFDAGNILSFNPENGTPDATNDPFCGDAALTLISAIQGTGNSVTDTATTFEVQAIVVGDHQENFEFDGFFIQEEDADADGDPTTSEGIFVYCGSDGSNCPDVAYGDQVTVTAQASDFFGMSQLEPTSSADVVIESSNNPIPTPATVSFPVPAPVNNVDYLERFEGMYITIDTPMTITEYFDYDRRGRITLWTDGTVTTSNSVRPYQFTAQNAPDVTGFGDYEATFDTQIISLDDGSNAQNDDTTLPAPYPPGGFSPANTFRGGDVATGVDGVLNFNFGSWRVQGWDPSAGTETDGDPSLTFTDLNDRPATPPTLAAGNLRVASFNVLNYFNGDGQGGGFPTARGADTQNEFDRQRVKIIEAICLLDADIVGLNEIENDYADGANSAIVDLVAGLNASATCGNRVYDYVDPGQNIGTDAIAVGFVYDTNAVSLLNDVNNPAILDDNAAFITGTVFDGPDSNRNPLAATFVDANNGELTVIVNHFKSKGGSGTGDNADQGDGQGNWNARRTAAAQAIVDWIATAPTGSADDDYLVIGDLNAYDEEDPVTTLESNGFTDLVDQYQGDDAYGYVFSGQWGYLDYAMSSSTLTSQITGAADWHINADEPDALDYNEDDNPSSWYEANQYRSSDHDPVIVEVQLQGDTPPPPPNANLLQNPMFSDGLANWGLNGQYEFSLTNGVLEFYRQRPGWQGAVLFQSINQAIPSGAPMRVNLALGNNSDVEKSVQILLRSGDFQDVISCSVTIPANSFLRGVTIEDVTSTNWESALFSVRVYEQDGLGAVRVDNTIVQYVPDSGITGYSCSGYDTPESTNLMRNNDFSSGLLEWILFGDYEFTINSGVLEFYRPAAAPRIATLFQYIAGNVDSGAPLQTQVELGNSSTVEKTVSVIVRNADWSDFFRCDYTIPAGTPLTQVTVQGTTSVPWSDATLLVRALDADGEAAIRVDNASFVYSTALDTSTQCSTPSFGTGDTADVPEGMKAPTTIMPDVGIQPDTDGAAPAPIAPPNPGSIPEIPGF